MDIDIKRIAMRFIARKKFSAVAGGDGRSRAFTLIELLVVIAIIAMLLSMLLPALREAREQGKRVVCLTNLKNLGMAYNFYSDDNNGFYPVVVDRSTGELLLTALQRYFEGTRIWSCPTEDRPDIINSNEYAYCAPLQLGYIQPNGQPFNNRETYARKRRSQARVPHRTTIMFDAVPRNRYPYYDLTIRGMWEPSWRHTRKSLCNFLFIDLHVDHYRSSIVPPQFIDVDSLGEPSYYRYFSTYSNNPTFQWFDPW